MGIAHSGVCPFIFPVSNPAPSLGQFKRAKAGHFCRALKVSENRVTEEGFFGAVIFIHEFLLMMPHSIFFTEALDQSPSLWANPGGIAPRNAKPKALEGMTSDAMLLCDHAQNPEGCGERQWLSLQWQGYGNVQRSFPRPEGASDTCGIGSYSPQVL